MASPADENDDSEANRGEETAIDEEASIKMETSITSKDNNYMSDSSEEFDTDLDADTENSMATEDAMRDNVDIGHHSYMEACSLLKTTPIRLVIDQLREREIRLQHVGLNTDDVIALSYALLQNHRVESVDLEDNGLTEEALLHVVEVLRHNISITSLSLSENRSSRGCALALGDLLRDTTWLTNLNLSGSHIGDAGAKHIASGIRGNVSLVWMNLSNNDISETGSKAIGKSLSINDTLRVLDLSWNHIRRMGAVAICRGLHDNKALANLNLSWNGFGFEGSIALEEALKCNGVLKVLDISNNRINWEGIVYVCRGLKLNNTLQILKIGNNPISMEGCQKLLQAISRPKCALLHVGLEDIPVNVKIIQAADSITASRMFSLTHGGVLDTRDVIGIRKERPIDPLTLLIRYIGLMGIRVIDLFRMFDQDYHGQVTKDNFIRGIKKIGAPLSDSDLKSVARRLDRKGHISYSVLANGVRNHMREERKEDKKFELLERKRREERKRILKTGVADFRAPMITEISYFRTSATKNFEKLLSSPSASSIGKERYLEKKRSLGQFLPELQNDGSISSRSAISMSMSSYRRPGSKLSGGNLSIYSELSGSVATTTS